MSHANVDKPVEHLSRNGIICESRNSSFTSDKVFGSDKLDNEFLNSEQLIRKVKPKKRAFIESENSNDSDFESKRKADKPFKRRKGEKYTESGKISKVKVDIPLLKSKNSINNNNKEKENISKQNNVKLCEERKESQNVIHKNHKKTNSEVMGNMDTSLFKITKQEKKPVIKRESHEIKNEKKEIKLENVENREINEKNSEKYRIKKMEKELKREKSSKDNITKVKVEKVEVNQLRIEDDKCVKKEEKELKKEIPEKDKLKKEKQLKKENEQKLKHDIKKDNIKPKTNEKEHRKRKADGNKVKKEVASQKKKTESEDQWKWWNEDPLPDGQKWLTLEHHGPYFPPEYEMLPCDIKFHYDGKHVKLSKDTEEVACFYGKMLNHDYTKNDIFNKNFFNDWKNVMTKEERKTIKSLDKCDFTEIFDYFSKQSEAKKALSKEEKDKLKAENNVIVEKYGYCLIDGHKQRVGNFRIEPPGLFRGRGDHPKQGKIKNRTTPMDVTINIGKNAKVPSPPFGNWKSVVHDNTVSWLACWTENIGGNIKYVLLNPTARVKGQKDMEKYNIARNLHGIIDKIRADYRSDWKSNDMRIRQRSVALYFIDKLALRAGHEKEEGEAADTVGCCSLRIEHIKLHLNHQGEDFVVEFDFLGKDSVRYVNFVPVEKQVFKNLKLFKKNKENGDDLFDRLTTSSLNKYLTELMPGLTAKVFRTYNASTTLQAQLNLLTKEEDSVNEKLLSYNRANRAVAILCNHQRSVPKTFDKTMENLNNKLKDKNEQISVLKKEIKKLKKEKNSKDLEKKQKKLSTFEQQKLRLELNLTDKEENKEIALGTSKLNYLDPRISVAWCKKFEVPVEKVYNKTQREKFQWAIEMTEDDFVF